MKNKFARTVALTVAFMVSAAFAEASPTVVRSGGFDHVQLAHASEGKATKQTQQKGQKKTAKTKKSGKTHPHPTSSAKPA